VLLITADRGLAGAYSSAAIKEGEQLTSLIHQRGMTWCRSSWPQGPWRTTGSARREVAEAGTGFTDQPTYAHAKEIAAALLESFLTPPRTAAPTRSTSSTTQFESMVHAEHDGSASAASRSWRPTKEERPPRGRSSRCTSSSPPVPRCSTRLLPKYVENLVFTALLLSAASEHAVRRRAMKSATDKRRGAQSSP